MRACGLFAKINAIGPVEEASQRRTNSPSEFKSSKCVRVLCIELQTTTTTPTTPIAERKRLHASTSNTGRSCVGKLASLAEVPQYNVRAFSVWRARSTIEKRVDDDDDDDERR